MQLVIFQSIFNTPCVCQTSDVIRRKLQGGELNKAISVIYNYLSLYLINQVAIHYPFMVSTSAPLKVFCKLPLSSTVQPPIISLFTCDVSQFGLPQSKRSQPISSIYPKFLVILAFKLSPKRVSLRPSMWDPCLQKSTALFHHYKAYPASSFGRQRWQPLFISNDDKHRAMHVLSLFPCTPTECWNELFNGMEGIYWKRVVYTYVQAKPRIGGGEHVLSPYINQQTKSLSLVVQLLHKLINLSLKYFLV